MSEFLSSIVKSIDDFSFSNYGLDDLDELKRDPQTRAWVYDLAHKIEEDWCNYVDGN